MQTIEVLFSSVSNVNERNLFFWRKKLVLHEVTMISVLLFVSFLVFVSGNSATDTYELTLLHTNDLHSRFDQGNIYKRRLH